MEEGAGATRVDLAEVAGRAGGAGVVWKLAREGRDLDVNLVHLDAGGRIEPHVNDEVDVLLVGVAGGAVVEGDGERHALGPGVLVWLAKGTRRAVTAGGAGVSYVSAHRSRPGVMIGARPARRE